LLGDAAAQLLVVALDLVQLARPGQLADALLLADLVGLGDQLLAALLGRVLLVLAGDGGLDLGLDSILWGGGETARSAVG
jgi:hypothetical protein